MYKKNIVDLNELLQEVSELYLKGRWDKTHAKHPDGYIQIDRAAYDLSKAFGSDEVYFKENAQEYLDTVKKYADQAKEPGKINVNLKKIENIIHEEYPDLAPANSKKWQKAEYQDMTKSFDNKQNDRSSSSKNDKTEKPTIGKHRNKR